MRKEPTAGRKNRSRTEPPLFSLKSVPSAKWRRSRRQGLESGTSGRSSVCDVVLQWLISAPTCICAQSNSEVRRASTSDGISGGQTNRCSAAKNYAEENHVTVSIELLWACARKRKVA